jgi:CTP:molybdopterin cytidylyltransferase MocA
MRPESATALVLSAGFSERMGDFKPLMMLGGMTILERVFRLFKFELPSTSIQFFEVARETVEDPERALKGLLKTQASARQESMRAEIENRVDD